MSLQVSEPVRAYIADFRAGSPFATGEKLARLSPSTEDDGDESGSDDEQHWPSRVHQEGSNVSFKFSYFRLSG